MENELLDRVPLTELCQSYIQLHRLKDALTFYDGLQLDKSVEAFEAILKLYNRANRSIWDSAIAANLTLVVGEDPEKFVKFFIKDGRSGVSVTTTSRLTPLAIPRDFWANPNMKGTAHQRVVQPPKRKPTERKEITDLGMLTIKPEKSRP